MSENCLSPCWICAACTCRVVAGDLAQCLTVDSICAFAGRPGSILGWTYVTITILGYINVYVYAHASNTLLYILLNSINFYLYLCISTHSSTALSYNSFSTIYDKNIRFKSLIMSQNSFKCLKIA